MDRNTHHDQSSYDALAQRMFKVVAFKLDELEQYWGNDETHKPEQDARTLSSLARTLHILHSLKTITKPQSNEQSTVNLETLRSQVTQRLEALCKARKT